MDVNKIREHRASVGQTDGAKPVDPGIRTGGTRSQQSEAAGKSSTAADSLKLSDGYQEVANVKKVMMDREDIRMDRVEDYRKRIETDTYQVEPDKIAGKMLEAVW